MISLTMKSSIAAAKIKINEPHATILDKNWYTYYQGIIIIGVTQIYDQNPFYHTKASCK